MEAKVNCIFLRAYEANKNIDLSELKQFQKMFMKYLHLMMDINVLTTQISMKPSDVGLLEILHAKNMVRSRCQWNDLYETLRSVELQT